MWPFKKKNEGSGQVDLEKVGRVLYAEHLAPFDTFCRSYTNDREQFLNSYREEHEGMGKDPSTLELLYAFGSREGSLLLVDWHGEENEGEIDEFIEERIGQGITWTHTAALRSSVPEESQRDGRFIQRLLGSIDQDLRLIGKRLLLFDLPWDSYIIMPVSEAAFATLMEMGPGFFKAPSMLK
ncbi:MAG: hypothetical protein KF797_07475 [Flavobacteriales bacterium]|nr:hypothetical protein [Flavobacteriales bacterium]